MTALEILKNQLEQMGADGLCIKDCGCGLADLAPCGEWIGECVPAVAVEERILDVGEECEIIYIPLEPNNE